MTPDFDPHWHSSRANHRGEVELLDGERVCATIGGSRGRWSWTCEWCAFTSAGWAGPDDAWMAFLAHEPECAWRLVEAADLERTMRVLAALERRLVARDVVRRDSAA